MRDGSTNGTGEELQTKIVRAPGRGRETRGERGLRAVCARLATAAAAASFLALPAIVVGFGFFLRTHDWEWGRQRCALLALLAIAVLVARPSCPAILRSRVAAALLWAGALVAVALDARIGIESVRLAATTGEIRLDQGQHTLRAARLLLRGESPYAQGQLIDLEAYATRGEERARAGLVTPRDPGRVRLLAARWWSTLDPAARDELLPPAPPGNQAAVRERALYGYKYGPLQPLVVAPLQAILGPAAIPILQLTFWLLLLALLAASLRAAEAGWGPTGFAILCLSLEPSIATNFLYYSATDVWALAAMAGALLAFLRGRPIALGLCVGAAVACKILPSLLLGPMLLVAAPGRGRARFVAPVACLLLLIAVCAPFVAADPLGFWSDVVLWPSAMRPDNTHWSFYASPALRAVVRVLLGCAILAGAAYLLARRERAAASWLRFLAACSVALILGASAFHNNYETWFAVWAVCAVVASGSPSSASAQAPAPSGNT